MSRFAGALEKSAPLLLAAVPKVKALEQSFNPADQGLFIAEWIQAVLLALPFRSASSTQNGESLIQRARRELVSLTRESLTAPVDLERLSASHLTLKRETELGSAVKSQQEKLIQLAAEEWGRPQTDAMQDALV